MSNIRTAPTLPENLGGEVQALTAEAERIAPRLAELANRYQALERSIIEWERTLPAETDEQSQRRWEEQGTIRLEDLMQALVSVANVLPHKVEEHEYGYRELERLVPSGSSDEWKARRTLRDWNAQLDDQVNDVNQSAGWALDLLGSSRDEDTVRMGLLQLAEVAAFVHQLRGRLEGEVGWALDVVTRPDPLGTA